MIRRTLAILVRALVAAVLLAAEPAAAATGPVVLQVIAVPPRLAARALIPARVQLTNPRAVSQFIDVRLDVGRQHTGTHTGRFATRVELAPGEVRAVTVPLLAYPGDEVEATAVDAAGTTLGQDRRRAEVYASAHLGILHCLQEPVCQTLQTRISFAGSDEDRVRKRRELGFEVFPDLPAEWWGYAGSAAVVVASPLGLLSAAQLAGLETYARQGGLLVLVEELAGEPAFLASYRGTVPAADAPPIPIGLGRLVRVPTLAADGLVAPFAGPGLEHMLRPAHEGARLTHHAFEWRDEVAWLRERLASRLTWPGLGHVSLWLALYIALVGPVNFLVLRWLGRPEWGWATIPLVALIAAVALYWSSSAHRPRQFSVDQVVIYWLDDRSPVAGMDVALRVTAPQRAAVTLTVADGGVLTGPGDLGRSAWPALRGGGGGSGDRPWSVRVDSPVQFDLRLLQWSYADVELRGARRLPGTVVRGPDGRLRNDTGQTFREALYVDSGAVSWLGAMPAGGLVDPGAGRRAPLGTHTGRCLTPALVEIRFP